MDQEEAFSVKGKEHTVYKLKKSTYYLHKFPDNGILSLMVL